MKRILFLSLLPRIAATFGSLLLCSLFTVISSFAADYTGPFAYTLADGQITNDLHGDTDSPADYRVTFNFNYDGKADSVPIVSHGSLLTPSPPVRDGYTFIGWHTDDTNNTPYDFETPITGPLTLYAQWTPALYTFTFDFGYEKADSTCEELFYGTTLILSTPVREGYAFNGWYKQERDTIPCRDEIQVTGNTTLYAKWTIYTYTVTYKFNYPERADSVLDEVEHFTPLILSTPVREGYAFGEWFKEEACTNQWPAGTQVTDTTTLWAKWTIETYTVTFDFNYDRGDSVRYNVNHFTILTPSTPVREGSVFNRWYTSDESVPYDFAGNAVTANITFYASWTINQYPVTFNANGGTAVPQQTIYHGAKIPSFTYPDREGYPFGGWFRTATFSGSAWDFGTDTVTAALTLHAKWDTLKYTVRYHFGYNKDDSVISNVPHFSALTASTPVREGYTFDTWRLTSAAGAAYDFVNAQVTANLDLYAKWNANPQAITYELYGGTKGGNYPASVLYDGALNTPTPPPTRTGHIFDGWWDAETGGTQYSFPIQSITVPLTLHAHWSLASYAITFNFNYVGKNDSAPVIVYYGNPLTNPADIGKTPAFPNNAFDGWWSLPAGGIAYNFSAPVSGPFTLYAHWIYDPKAITYELHGGTKGGNYPANITNGGTLNTLTLPTRTGYTFAEWWDAETDGTQYTFPIQSITAPLTLHAHWTIISYRITFNLNGATGTAIDNQTIDHGGKIAEPESYPGRTGYTFGGWYTDATCTDKWLFDTNTVTRALTLYAKWLPIPQTVSFDANGGLPAPAAQNIDYGTAVSQPAPMSKTGYTFDRWYINDEDIPYNFGSPVTYPFTLTAKWTIVNYTVTFDLKCYDALNAPPNQSIPYNNTANPPSIPPSRPGYIFDGWYSESNYTATYDFDILITRPTTIYAKWSVNSYPVTFNLNYGPVTETETPAEQPVEYGSRIARPDDPERTGHLFDGWFTEQALTKEWDFNNGITGKVTLFAKWTPITATVTYIYGYYTNAPTPTRKSVTYPAPLIALADPDRSDYVFKGWSTDEDNTEGFYDNFGKPITTDFELYAIWTPSYTITLHPNYADAPPPETVTKESGLYLEEPDVLLRTGYTFGGWYKDIDGNQPADFSKPITASATFYAKWIINTFQVTINVDGGKPTPMADVMIVDYNTYLTQPDALSKTGYSFRGWYTSYNILYTFNDLGLSTLPVTDNLTLIAKWDINTYLITFHYNYPGTPSDGSDGSDNSDDSSDYPDEFTESFTYGSYLTEEAYSPDDIEGYTFAGWYSKPSGGVRWDATAPIARDAILYAHWQSLSDTALDVIPDANSYGNDDSDATYYDLKGHRVAHPEKGRLYIIIYSNGTRQLIINN